VDVSAFVDDGERGIAGPAAQEVSGITDPLVPWERVRFMRRRMGRRCGDRAEGEAG
jgi:hypothetical protein